MLKKEPEEETSSDDESKSDSDSDRENEKIKPIDPFTKMNEDDPRTKYLRGQSKTPHEFQLEGLYTFEGYHPEGCDKPSPCMISHLGFKLDEQQAEMFTVSYGFKMFKKSAGEACNEE